MDSNNPLYMIDKTLDGISYWNHVVPKCNPRAKTKLETGEDGKGIVSKLSKTNVHTHTHRKLK